MTRSTLNRINLLWTIGWLLMLACACSTTWTTEAINIITLLSPAISSALAILAAFGVGLSPAMASAVEAWSSDAITGLGQVKTLINQYNTAIATAKPGLLTEIETVLSTITANLASILPTIKVTDPATQAKILAVIQAVQSELQALVTLIPSLQGKTEAFSEKEMEALVKASGVKGAKMFRVDFNTKVDALGPDAKQYEI